MNQTYIKALSYGENYCDASHYGHSASGDCGVVSGDVGLLGFFKGNS